MLDLSREHEYFLKNPLNVSAIVWTFMEGAEDSPLVLAELTAVVTEATDADAVTGETITATDRDAVVFFPFFFLFMVVHGEIFRVEPCLRFFNHLVINPLSHASRLPIAFLGILGGFSVSC